MDREHRGDLDLEVKIKDLEIECEMYKKNNQMYKEHISRIEAINESHKKINGQLRTRISRLETEVKELRQKVEDDKELIQSLYDYP